MKYLYLLITLFILAACGPKNLFDGTYEGNVSGDDITVLIQEDVLTLSISGEEDLNCTLEDPTTTPTMMSCDRFLNGPVEIDGDTLTISPEGEKVGVFKRVEK
tara:strand:- start:173 stop:481 length:309 start_codon:yes stop_codon:yes gene_type:complete